VLEPHPPGIDGPAILLDWDGTLRPGFLIMDWAEYLAHHGEIDPGVLDGMRNTVAMLSSGQIDYAESAAQIPVLYGRAVRGREEARHRALARSYVEADEFTGPITPAGRRLLAFAGGLQGARGVVISGGPVAVLERFVQNFGIADVRATVPTVSSGVFTGEIVDNFATVAGKTAAVQAVAAAHHILLAAGDSESDLPILRAAHHRVTFGRHLAELWRDDPHTLALDDGLGPGQLRDLDAFLEGVRARR
jgi:phosphoserine phosphatase